MRPSAFFAMITALLLVGFALPANAQATRTWVSGVGDDANPCSRTAPCKTFAGAIAKTATFGEINCLDPGGFGGVTITKSISLDCESVEGGVLVSGTNGISVSVATTDTVYLRGLDIEGITTGLSGVSFVGAGTLHIEKCLIRGFNSASAGFGISFNPNNTAALYVADTVVTDNGTAAIGGNISIVPTASANVAVSLERVQMTAGTLGLKADGTNAASLNVSIDHSLVAGSRFAGYTATTSNGPVQMMINNSTSANNATFGLRAVGAQASLFVGNSVDSGNGTDAAAVNSATLKSYGNNQIDFNGVNTTTIPTTALR